MTGIARLVTPADPIQGDCRRLDRAFYDRRFDWVLSVDEPARVELTPGARAEGDNAGCVRYAQGATPATGGDG